MNFGTAIEVVKSGELIARQGWNGKNMFVRLEPGSSSTLPHSVGSVGGVSARHFTVGSPTTVTRMPCLVLRAVDGSDVEGWAPSQVDMLAEDWEIVKNGK